MSGKVDNFSTNVLIIGKSGVGKSSLLNYIFDQQLAETGSGKPVTKEEIYKYSMEHPSGMTVYVFDTWGLEADKADRWTKLIMDEVTAHDCADICDWFHTILYCISARSARIEDFERQQIKLLLDSGNRVIVCLTHCDARNVEQSISALTAELCAIGLTEKDIIQTVSVSKKLLGSSEAAPRRGREEILLKIQSNLWETVAAKLPAQLTEYSDKAVDEWFEFCCEGAKEELNSSNANSADFKNFILKTASKHLQKVIGDVEKEYRRRASEAMDYYKKLCSAISVEVEDFGTDFDINISFDKFYDCSDAMDEAISAFFHAVPLFGSWLSRLDIDNAYYQLEHRFKEQADKTKGELVRYFYSLADKMKKQSPNNESDERELKVIDKDIFVDDEIEFMDCRLDFQAMIYLSQETKIVLYNCDISVDPTLPAAIYGNNAEITLMNCRLTYHGSDVSESYFILGDELTVTFVNTEFSGCYCMYSNRGIHNRLKMCNSIINTDNRYNVPKDFSDFSATKSSVLKFIKCRGKIDYSVSCDQFGVIGIYIIMNDSAFTHTGSKFSENDYAIFESSYIEANNCTFDNFSAKGLLRFSGSGTLRNCTFRNCSNAAYSSIGEVNTIVENCIFEDCKGGIDIPTKSQLMISDCTFKNCCGKMIDCGDMNMENCKLDGGMPYIRARESTIKACEFTNWSMRYAMPRIGEDPNTYPIVFFRSPDLIENCLFADISLTDAGSSSSCGWSLPDYLIVGTDGVYDITVKNTEFRNISTEEGIIRTAFDYIEEEEAFLPFLPPKEVVKYHYTDLTVENCTGIDSDGNAI